MSSLFKLYRENARRLNTTGMGLNNVNDDDVHKYASSYVGADGPDETTSTDVRNTWGMLLSSYVVESTNNNCVPDELCVTFPFFPNLHRLLSSKPNMRPPALTTGVGPHGRQVIHLQPPKSTPLSLQSQNTLYRVNSLDRTVMDPELLCSTSQAASVPPLDNDSDSDESVPLSGWSESSFTASTSTTSNRTPLRLATSNISNRHMSTTPSPVTTQTSSQVPQSIDLDDKENQQPASSSWLDNRNKQKTTNPALAAAISQAEKKIGTPIKRKSVMEEQIYVMHS